MTAKTLGERLATVEKQNEGIEKSVTEIKGDISGIKDCLANLNCRAMKVGQDRNTEAIGDLWDAMKPLAEAKSFLDGNKAVLGFFLIAFIQAASIAVNLWLNWKH